MRLNLSSMPNLPKLLVLRLCIFYKLNSLRQLLSDQFHQPFIVFLPFSSSLTALMQCKVGNHAKAEDSAISHHRLQGENHLVLFIPPRFAP